MGMSDMGDFQFQSLVDPGLPTDPPSFDEMYAFGIPGGDFIDASQCDATFDFEGFDFEQPAIHGVNGGFAVPTTPQSSFPDQRYVSLPSQSQTHPSSVWRPLEQPVQQLNYPDPEIFSQPPIASTPYYPLQPFPSSNMMMQNDFGAITPPGKQFSSIDHPLFLHGNIGPPPDPIGIFSYEPIQAYQNDGAFNPEDLALSAIPEDLVLTAIREGWALSRDNTQQGPLPYDLFDPDHGNDGDAELSDACDSEADCKPSSSAKAKTTRRSKRSRPQAVLPNGEVKKGRPCAKPQTEERKRINQRRMDGYYRRKYDQGNLEKARQQSKESYYRRKQRKIEAGENVRSYKAPKRAKTYKKT